MTEKTFTEIGHFAATNAAEAWLTSRGFSVGFMEGNAPRGIRHGDCVISKWRNLSAQDKLAMHGAISGDHRLGPVTVDLFDSAPAEARAAFAVPEAALAQ